MRAMLTGALLCTLVQAQAGADSLHTHAPRWTVRGQFAGMQGLASLGALWNTPDGRLQLGASYGHAPGRHGDVDFHCAALRAAGSWFPMHRPQVGRWNLSPTASLTAMLEVSGITFLFLPPEYPKGYYLPQAIHGLLGLGGRLGYLGTTGQWAITAELVTMDTYLWYSIIQHEVDFHRIWNLALGVEYRFGSRQGRSAP